MIDVVDVRRNRLLSALPEAELQRWLPQFEEVDLPLGHALYEPGATVTHVYFPTTRIVSLLYVLENGGSAEIAVVGNEGIVGIALFMGGGSTPNRTIVQSAGKGLRLGAQAMTEEFHRAGPVLQLLLRYTQALIAQMSQTAVCNRHHGLDQQLCRWLLIAKGDRSAWTTDPMPTSWMADQVDLCGQDGKPSGDHHGPLAICPDRK